MFCTFLGNIFVLKTKNIKNFKINFYRKFSKHETIATSSPISCSVHVHIVS